MITPFTSSLEPTYLQRDKTPFEPDLRSTQCVLTIGGVEQDLSAHHLDCLSHQNTATSQTFDREEKKSHSIQNGFWINVENEFNRWYSKVRFHNPSVEKVTPLVSEYFNHKTDGLLAIDLGCGQGYTSIHLLQRGWKVIAIDRALEPLETLKRNANKINDQWIRTGQLTIYQETLEEWNLTVQADLVVIADTLPYINPARSRHLWDRMSHALRKEGKIVSSFFRRGFRTESVMRANGAWFVDSLKAVQTMIINSPYQLETCRVRPKAYKSCVVEFIASKL